MGRAPHKYSQAERVLELYRRLLQPAGFVSPSLDYPDFGCDKRTLQRDMRVLRNVLGDDLEHVDEPHLGWVYRLTPRARDWEVQPSQVLAIVAGARATQFVSGRRFSNEIQPLLEQLRTSLRAGDKLRLRNIERKVYVTRIGEKTYTEDPALQDILGVMVGALMFEQPVSLAYHSHRRRDRGKAPQSVLIHPLSLVFHRGGVYFVVDVVELWDGDMPLGRSLMALDRISDCVLRDDLEQFTYPADFRAETFFHESFGIFTADPLDVVVRISAFMKPYVLERRWNGTETFEEQADGTLHMSITVRGDLEILQWILGMGEHACVLEPESLRAKARSRLKSALEAYEREG